MSRDKKSRKEDADFELEADVEPSTEPTIDVEQEMAAISPQDAVTQPEQSGGKTKASISRASQRIESEPPKIDLERAAPARTRQESKSYKEKVMQPTSEDIYKALKKPDGFGFARKILLVAIVAAALFYGQRFWKRTKELVPFPDAPVSNAPANNSKSIGSQLEDATLAIMNKERPPVYTDVIIESDLVDIQVLVNGKTIAVAGQKFQLEVGKSYVIEMKRQGFSDYRTEFVPEEGKVTKLQPQFTQEVASGFLTIETTPESRLTIFRDDKIFHEGNTPMSGFKVPSGKYRLVIENPLIGYRSEEEFTIYKSVTTSIRKELQAK
jgi:hypothetical protein